MQQWSKIQPLTELGKLSVSDRVLIFFITVYTPITIIFSNEIILIVHSVILIYLNRLLWQGSFKLSEKPFLYKPFIWAFTLCVTGIGIFTLLSLFDLKFSATVVLVLAMYSYLFIFVTIIYYILNLIYILILKNMFPYEGEKEIVDHPTLKDLSRFIDLDTQKNYLTISILETFIYLVGSAFAFGLLIKHVSFTELTPLIGLSNWVNKQSYLTIFNGLSLFSIMFAIYTVTIPWKKKIRNETTGKYR